MSRKRTDLKNPRTHKLSLAQKKAVIAHVAQGRSKADVAREFHVTIQSVSSLCRDVPFLMQNPAQALRDWRQRFREKAQPAVEAGLDCEEDAYKRAAVGLKVLQGLGDLNPDQVSVTQVWANAPGSLLKSLGIPLVEETRETSESTPESTSTGSGE